MAPTCVFLFAGEGAHSALSEDELRELTSLLASSPSFSRVDGALRELVSKGVEQFLAANLGRHSAPHSPVVTTVLNLLLADMWRGWVRLPLPPPSPAVHGPPASQPAARGAALRLHLSPS